VGSVVINTAEDNWYLVDILQAFGIIAMVLEKIL